MDWFTIIYFVLLSYLCYFIGYAKAQNKRRAFYQDEADYQNKGRLSYDDIREMEKLGRTE